MKMSEAKLDRDTNEVICDECGNVIQGITSFMKKSLEATGQVTRSIKKQAFQTQCLTCKKSQPMYVKERKAFCSGCNTHVKLSEAFLEQLMIYQSQKDKDID
jgi:hypothetical protein